MKYCNNTRKPQKRSIETKEKILDTAYKLFCEKGYFKTSTNEIAKVADISIGSLYSHYPDKDTIFLEILGRYNLHFIELLNELSQNMQLYLSDPRAWFRCLMCGLIKIHLDSKDLNREIGILSYTKPEIAVVRKIQHEHTRQIMYDFLSREKKLNVKDTEASIIIVMGLIDVIIEQVVFGDHMISDERIIEEGINAFLKYLLV